MQERHTNKEKYFNEQIFTSEKYVLPFLQEFLDVNQDLSILEIGCGEGGNLKPFLDRGCSNIVGVDLSQGKIELAKTLFKEHPNKNNIKFVCEDIYESQDLGKFDLILMRDVIEHIHDQKRFMGFVKNFLNDEGKIFFGFPPWYNPFGGHQQICESKILSKLPYFHLLPAIIYKAILKIFGESNAKIDALLEIKETGITIERFEKILDLTNYKIEKKTNFLFNPNYEIKFKIKPKEQYKLISSIPLVRNFVTTAVYYIVSIND